MTYPTKEETWYPVEIHTRNINGKRTMHKIPDVSLVCQFVEELKKPDEEEILLVLVTGTCVYSQLGNEPITWDDITGFFA